MKLYGREEDIQSSGSSSNSSSNTSEIDSEMSVGNDDIMPERVSPLKKEIRLHLKVKEDECDKMCEEMNKEMRKKNVNYNQVKCLLESTYQNRREMLSKWDFLKEPMVSTAVEKWSPLREGYFVS